MSEKTITLKGINVSYDRKIVLSNIYLEITQGKLYGILGPNGAGKSTLFKAILGLEIPNSGTVEVMGTSVETNRKTMVYVPQKSDVDWQFPATVFDIVMMGRYPHRGLFQRMTNHDKELAHQALKDVGIEHLATRQIGELSGGQQQRVFLARALCQQADIFLFDEPFVGVDVTTEEKIIQILKRLAKQNKTLLVVHHDLSKVKEYFDSVILLNQRLVAYGDTATTFTDENIAKTFGGRLTLLEKANFGL